jgi:hypothetical protein
MLHMNEAAGALHVDTDLDVHDPRHTGSLLLVLTLCCMQQAPGS